MKHTVNGPVYTPSETMENVNVIKGGSLFHTHE